MVFNQLDLHTTYGEDDWFQGDKPEPKSNATYKSPKRDCILDSVECDFPMQSVQEPLTSEQLLSNLKNDPLLDRSQMRPYQLFTYQLGLELVLDNYIIDDSLREKMTDNEPVFNDTTIADICANSEALQLNYIKCPVNECNFHTESASVNIN
jgi:hypothetical protein